MNILFLNHNFENFGTYFRCLSLAKALCRKGHRVDLICASSSNFDLRIRKKKINPNLNIITLPRIKMHTYYTGHTIRGVISSLFVLLKKYDILHSFAVAQPATAIPVFVAKAFKREPIIVDWDDLWGNGFGKYHPRLVNSALSFLEKNTPRLSDKITVVSEFLKDKAMGYKFPEHKITKIINGADIEAIKPMDKRRAREKMGFSENEIILLTVGHTYMDTLDILVDVYKKVLKEIKEVKFLMVGAMGRQNDIIHKKISALGKNLLFLGERPFRDIPYLLACADILVLPMKDSLIERARFPIRFGDYLASGRPIVSNAVGEVREIIAKEKCGLYSEPEDREGFAANIIELIDNRNLREEIGIKARQVAEEKLSWDKISLELVKVYKEALR